MKDFLKADNLEENWSYRGIPCTRWSDAVFFVEVYSEEFLSLDDQLKTLFLQKKALEARLSAKHLIDFTKIKFELLKQIDFVLLSIGILHDYRNDGSNVQVPEHLLQHVVLASPMSVT